MQISSCNFNKNLLFHLVKKHVPGSTQIVTLSVHFPGGPGLAGTRMSPFWILLELRLMEVVVTTGAIGRANLQSNHYHQQTNTQFLGSTP